MKASIQEKFEQALDELNIRLETKPFNSLFQYYQLLIEANQRMNLTAITDIEAVFIKHFIDSLSILRIFEKLNLKEYLSIIDIGCGAGFPGIPLKITIPQLRLTSVDSTGKKIDFIRHCIEELGLTSCTALKARAEDLAHGSYRESYDLSLSRAVSHLSVLSEYSIPLLKTGGLMIAYKATTAEEELKESSSALKKLHCRLLTVDSFSLPFDGGRRNNLVIKKEKPTDMKYPRAYGQIKNNPL